MIRGQPVRFRRPPGIGLVFMAGNRVAEHRFHDPPLRFHRILVGEQRLFAMQRVSQKTFIRRHLVFVLVRRNQLDVFPEHALAREASPACRGR